MKTFPAGQPLLAAISIAALYVCTPGAAKAQPPASLPIHLEADPDVTLHVVTQAPAGDWFFGAQRKYERVCKGRCEGMLPAGLQHLALSSGKGTPLEIDQSVDVRGPLALRASYERKDRTRTFGLALFLVSLGGGGGGLIGAAAAMGCLDQDACRGTSLDVDLVLVVGAVSVAGILVGGVLTFVPDRASVTLVPLRTSSSTGGYEGAPPLSAPGIRGLGLQTSF